MNTYSWYVSYSVYSFSYKPRPWHVHHRYHSNHCPNVRVYWYNSNRMIPMYEILVVVVTVLVSTKIIILLPIPYRRYQWKGPPPRHHLHHSHRHCPNMHPSFNGLMVSWRNDCPFVAIAIHRRLTIISTTVTARVAPTIHHHMHRTSHTTTHQRNGIPLSLTPPGLDDDIHHRLRRLWVVRRIRILHRPCHFQKRNRKWWVRWKRF